MPKSNKRKFSVESEEPAVKIEKFESPTKNTVKLTSNNNAAQRKQYADDELYGPDRMSETKPSTSRGRKKSPSISESVNNGEEHSKKLKVPPSVLYNFCEKLLNKAAEPGSSLDQKVANADLTKFIDADDEILKYFNRDIKAVQTLFRQTYTEAASLRNTKLTDALQKVRSFMQVGKSVEKHHNYPTKPLTAYAYFLKLNNLTGFTVTPEISARFKNKDDPQTKSAEEEHRHAMSTFVERLEAFLDDHRKELLDNHVKYVQAQIKNFNNKLSPKTKTAIVQKPKSPLKSTPKMSAFDFYAMSKKDKYTDLPEDERERKLRKRFEKLTPERLEIFESLANNS